MSIDFNKPIIRDAYAFTLENIRTMVSDLARGLEPTLTGGHSFMPVGTIHWSATAARWERYNGVSWDPLAAAYAINISGNAATASTAANLPGGASGSLVWQSAAGTTAFVAPGTAGQVLFSGGGATPSWGPQSGMTVGAATTATNLSGGSITTGVNTASVGSGGGTNTQFMSNTSNAAAISFHRAGAYAINMGLDVDNVFRLGGWSDGTNTYRLTIDSAGNFLARGDVRAFSDERLKESWRPLAADFVTRLARLLSGTYQRIDSGLRQVGIGGQHLQKLLPEAVSADENGTLSVAYGQAAMVSCVELAREVVALRDEVAELTRLSHHHAVK